MIAHQPDSEGPSARRTALHRRALLSPLLAACALLTLSPVAAQASGPPLITATSFSGVSETAATLKATVNPNEREVTDYHFQYISEADWHADGESFGEGTHNTPAGQIAGSAEELKADHPVSAQVAGLAAGAAYRLRLFARNVKSPVEGTLGPEITLHTLAPAPSFGPCPNDPFRSGEYTPPAQPSSLLPDCRAYERASPQNKDGGDVLSAPLFVKAAADGDAISFTSAFGLPGGAGAQALPAYLASRGEGEAGWATSGLLPPAALGPKGLVLGWLPDFSASFAIATHLGSPRTQALYELHPDGAAPTQIAPYTPVTSTERGLYSYVGAAGGSVVFFEATAALPPEEGQPPIAAARQGSPNLYSWDAATGRLSLVSQLNSEAQSDAELPKGAFAGPYNWARADLSRGGAEASYYTQEERAVSDSGQSAFFSAKGSGQLYERLHPTMPQSPLDGQGQCSDPELACTLHVSASEKNNGPGGGPDPAGSAPAAFQLASSDGSLAFFTSSEKLTDNANTGPEEPPAQIGAATAGATEPEEVEESLLPAHALGVALSPDGEHIYWANPADHSIGRAKIDPLTGAAGAPEPDFIVPEETECENHFEEPGVFNSAPATPRYVAVDAEHVYWTNTGPLGKNQFSGGIDEPVKGCGTIGRATIDPLSEEAEDVRPEFITGAFNPQGVAVDSEHVYWANAGTALEGDPSHSIGRAPIGGGTGEVLHVIGSSVAPSGGLALDGSHVYYAVNDADNNQGYIERIPLAGGAEESIFVGAAGVRGVALDGGYVYWASQRTGAIGRYLLAEFGAGKNCAPGQAEHCEAEYLKLQGAPEGLAADPATDRLYWSVNGEAPLNPGTDLYRFDASAPVGHRLTDLTVTGDENGAEAVGVLGASADGTNLYFAANGVLAAGASGGDCHTTSPHGTIALISGHCNLYRRHEDPETHIATTSFVARLNVGGGAGPSDVSDLLPTPLGLFGAGSYEPKSAELSTDGLTLFFRSQERLSAYENHGVPELYRYRVGDVPPIRCLTCNPTGAAPAEAPSFGGTDLYPNLRPNTTETAALANRFLAAGGDRAFFETSEALVGNDTNGAGGCPVMGPGPDSGTPSCNDVYEWEAPGSGSCTQSSPSYTAIDEGCIYLISTGKSPYPSYFADAGEAGKDVFFFTREGLVGQDTDSLRDVYDARIEGGLTAQNPVRFKGCEGEACKPGATPQTEGQSPATPAFHGPGNHAGKPQRCPKGTRKAKARGGAKCRKPRRGHHRHRHHRRTHR